MKSVLVMVPDGSDEMELTPLVEIPGWTRLISGVEHISVTVAGWCDPIRLFHGLVIKPDLTVPEVNVNEYDALCLPRGVAGHSLRGAVTK